MSYLDNYRRKMTKTDTPSMGKSRTDILNEKAKRTFERTLRNDISAKVLKVSDVGEVGITDTTKSIRVIINEVSANDQKSFDEKYLITRLEDNVDIGCYVVYENSYWLVIFKEHKSIESHKKFVIKKCNQIVRYQYEGAIYEIPCVVKNLVQYSDGLRDIVYTSTPDSKRNMTYGINHVTENIKLGQRFMLDREFVFRVTHVDTFQYNVSYEKQDGIATAIVVHTSLRDTDGIEDNLADNGVVENEEIDVHIKGNDKVMFGGKYKYSLSEKLYTDWEIEYIKGNGFATLVKGDGVCSISIKNDTSIIGCSFKLKSLTNANVVQAEKIITVVGF